MKIPSKALLVVIEIGAATLSDPNGVFGFSGVAPGTYTLSFTLGDNASTVADVVVSAGATTNADFDADWVVSLAETITVFSASRRQEKFVDAPAAISLITEIEID